MREALKNLFAKQITLENGSVFSYNVSSYEMKNVLGKSLDLLAEYTIVEKDKVNGFSCKLYKTKDNSWYDFEQARTPDENHIIRMLKAAIDGEQSMVSSL